MKPKLQVLEQKIATDTKEGIKYIRIYRITRFKNADRTSFAYNLVDKS